MTAVRVLQITDTHLVGDPAGRQRGLVVLDSLRAVLSQALREPTDLILLTGDIVHDDPQGYAMLREVFDTDIPVLCVPGNHDVPQAMRDILGVAPFRIGGHHDLGAWRLVMLDSQQPGQVGGRLNNAELQRLDEALRSAPRQHALVVLHHPPIAMGSTWLDDARQGRHSSVPLMATPSTCVQFRPKVPNFDIDERPPGYRRLTLHEGGHIETTVGWLE